MRLPLTYVYMASRMRTSLTIVRFPTQPPHSAMFPLPEAPASPVSRKRDFSAHHHEPGSRLSVEGFVVTCIIRHCDWDEIGSSVNATALSVPRTLRILPDSLIPGATATSTAATEYIGPVAGWGHAEC